VADVVVVGGGPVGLATALSARREQLEVSVVEARWPPLEKACGEGLMPTALAALSGLGVDLEGVGRSFSGIRYVGDGLVAEADFPGGATGRGVRRVDLQAVLTAAAGAAGVDLRFGVRATGLDAAGVTTGDGPLAARWVVGADGLRSRVRTWAGLDRPVRSGRRRFGVRRHLALPASSRVEVVFGDRAEAYLTPLGDRTTGVALLWSGAARGFDDLLARRFSAELGGRLASAERLSRDRGAGPFHVRARSAVSGSVALVGDAAGYLDALTGEGLAIGFQEALALGPALRRGELAGYARSSARLRRTPEAITRLALAMAARPRLRRRVLGGLAVAPEAFSALLGALAAGRPAGTLLRTPLLRFARGLAFVDTASS
jgi:2-polyprenyl-6-methoxyphenol hydroxylase-like FAD-dependent oxidoreductase